MVAAYILRISGAKTTVSYPVKPFIAYIQA